MVSLSFKYNFLCLYNLRCASIAIETYISNQPFVKKVIPYLKRTNIQTDFEYNERVNNSIIAKKICNLFEINYNKFFSFTTIRNPWDKMVSFYFFLRPDKNMKIYFHDDYDKNTAFYYNFNEWLKNIYDLYKSGNDIFKDYKINNFAFDENNNKQVTKIYNIETFTIQELCADINEYNRVNNIESSIIDFSDNIEKLNITYHKHYSNYYSDESINYVREMFINDIEIGNYSFIYLDELPSELYNNNINRKLTSKGWINNNYFPEAQLIYENRSIFIEELMHVLNSNSWPECGLTGYNHMVQTDIFPNEKNKINSTSNPAWRLFVFLYKDGSPTINEKYVPNSIKFLKENCSDKLKMAAFSLCEPGVCVGLHTDKNEHESKSYRIHIPLILPKKNNEHKGSTVLTYDEAINCDYAYIQIDNDYRIWRDDEYFIAFHDHLHSTYNNTNENRVLLFVDIHI